MAENAALPEVGIILKVDDRLSQSLRTVFNEFKTQLDQEIRSVNDRLKKFGTQIKNGLTNPIKKATKDAKTTTDKFGESIDNAFKKVRTGKKIVDDFTKSNENLVKKLKSLDKGLLSNKDSVTLLNARLDTLKKTAKLVGQRIRNNIGDFKDNSKILSVLEQQITKTKKSLSELSKRIRDHGKVQKEVNKVTDKFGNVINNTVTKIQKGKSVIDALTKSYKNLINDLRAANKALNLNKSSATLLQNKLNALNNVIKLLGQKLKNNVGNLQKNADKLKFYEKRVLQVKKALFELNQKNSSHVKGLNESNLAAKGWISSMKEIVKWQLKWFISGALIFGLINKITKAFSGFFKFEENLRRIGVILEKDIVKSGQNVAEALSGARDQLRNLSEESGRSAIELSDSLLVLVRTGLQLNDALSTLPSIIKLNTVAGGELIDSTNTVVTIMNAWEKSLKKVGTQAQIVEKISNVVAIAFNRTRLDTKDLNEVFKMAAATMGLLKVSYIEVAATAGLFRKQGAKASTIGRGMVNMFVRLAKRSESVQKALGLTRAEMEDMVPGINKVTGQFNSMVDIFDRLQQKGVTVAQLFKAFGLRAGRQAALGINVNVQALRDLVEELKTADILQGQFNKIMGAATLQSQRLFAAFDNLVAAILRSDTGFSKLLKVLTFIVNIMKGIVDVFNMFDGLLLGIPSKLIIAAGLFLVLGNAINIVTVALKALVAKKIIAGLTTLFTFSPTTTAIAAFGVALAILVDIFTDVKKTSADTNINLWEFNTVIGLNERQLTKYIQVLKQAGEETLSFSEKFERFSIKATATVFQTISNFVGGIFNIDMGNRFIDQLDKIEDQWSGIITVVDDLNRKYIISNRELDEFLKKLRIINKDIEIGKKNLEIEQIGLINDKSLKDIETYKNILKKFPDIADKIGDKYKNILAKSPEMFSDINEAVRILFGEGVMGISLIGDDVLTSFKKMFPELKKVLDKEIQRSRIAELFPDIFKRFEEDIDKFSVDTQVQFIKTLNEIDKAITSFEKEKELSLIPLTDIQVIDEQLRITEDKLKEFFDNIGKEEIEQSKQINEQLINNLSDRTKFTIDIFKKEIKFIKDTNLQYKLLNKVLTTNKELFQEKISSQLGFIDVLSKVKSKEKEIADAGRKFADMAKNFLSDRINLFSVFRDLLVKSLKSIDSEIRKTGANIVKIQNKIESSEEKIISLRKKRLSVIDKIFKLEKDNLSFEKDFINNIEDLKDKARGKELKSAYEIQIEKNKIMNQQLFAVNIFLEKSLLADKKLEQLNELSFKTKIEAIEDVRKALTNAAEEGIKNARTQMDKDQIFIVAEEKLRQLQLEKTKILEDHKQKLDDEKQSIEAKIEAEIDLNDELNTELAAQVELNDSLIEQREKIITQINEVKDKIKSLTLNVIDVAKQIKDIKIELDTTGVKGLIKEIQKIGPAFLQQKAIIENTAIRQAEDQEVIPGRPEPLINSVPDKPVSLKKVSASNRALGFVKKTIGNILDRSDFKLLNQIVSGDLIRQLDQFISRFSEKKQLRMRESTIIKLKKDILPLLSKKINKKEALLIDYEVQLKKRELEIANLETLQREFDKDGKDLPEKNLNRLNLLKRETGFIKDEISAISIGNDDVLDKYNEQISALKQIAALRSLTKDEQKTLEILESEIQIIESLLKDVPFEEMIKQYKDNLELLRNLTIKVFQDMGDQITKQITDLTDTFASGIKEEIDDAFKNIDKLITKLDELTNIRISFNEKNTASLNKIAETGLSNEELLAKKRIDLATNIAKQLAVDAFERFDLLREERSLRESIFNLETKFFQDQLKNLEKILETRDESERSVAEDIKTVGGAFQTPLKKGGVQKQEILTNIAILQANKNNLTQEEQLEAWDKIQKDLGKFWESVKDNPVFDLLGEQRFVTEQLDVVGAGKGKIFEDVEESIIDTNKLIDDSKDQATKDIKNLGIDFNNSMNGLQESTIENLTKELLALGVLGTDITTAINKLGDDPTSQKIITTLIGLKSVIDDKLISVIGDDDQTGLRGSITNLNESITGKEGLGGDISTLGGVITILSDAINGFTTEEDKKRVSVSDFVDRINPLIDELELLPGKLVTAMVNILNTLKQIPDPSKLDTPDAPPPVIPPEQQRGGGVSVAPLDPALRPGSTSTPSNPTTSIPLTDMPPADVSTEESQAIAKILTGLQKGILIKEYIGYDSKETGVPNMRRYSLIFKDMKNKQQKMLWNIPLTTGEVSGLDKNGIMDIISSTLFNFNPPVLGLPTSELKKGGHLKFNRGGIATGMINGPGSGTSDSIPGRIGDTNFKVSNGELLFVMKNAAAKAFLPFLEMFNVNAGMFSAPAMAMPSFKGGGVIRPSGNGTNGTQGNFNVNFNPISDMNFSNSLFIGDSGIRKFVQDMVQGELARNFDNHAGPFIKRLERQFGIRN